MIIGQNNKTEWVAQRETDIEFIVPIMKNRTLLIIIFGKNNCENQSETSLQKKT
jgi:hypothetical protein